MQSSGPNPSNIQSPEPTWTLVIILIVIIAILIIALFVTLFVMQRRIKKLQEQLKKEMSTEETNLLLKYRSLNGRDKNVIRSTLVTLSNNPKHNKE